VLSKTLGVARREGRRGNGATRRAARGVARREGRHGEWRLARPDRLTLTATPGADSVRAPALPNESRHCPTRAGTANESRRSSRDTEPGGRRGGQDEARPHRRRGERGGRLQDRGLVRLQQPERLNAETAARIRAVAEGLGYRPARGPDAHPEEHHDHRPADAAGPLRRLRQSLLRHTVWGSGRRHRPGRLRPVVRLAAPRVTDRALGRATVDGFVAVGLSEDHPRSNRSVAPASRWSSSMATHSRSTARSSRTTRSALDRPHAICSAWPPRVRGHRHRAAEHAGLFEYSLARPKRSPRDA